MVGKTGVHSPATFLQATGFVLPGFPGMGCWISYGLGSMNENLPTFVVLPDHRGLASNGPKNWDAGFLAGRSIRGRSIYPGRGRTRSPICFRQARSVRHARGRSRGHRIAGRLEPRACGERGRAMRGSRPASAATSWPRACSSPRPRRSICRRSRSTFCEMYGLDHGKTTFDKDINPLEEIEYFGRKCLVARRLLERGVRFVQVWTGNDNGFPRRNWDSHEDVERDHGPLAIGMARGAAAL